MMQKLPLGKVGLACWLCLLMAATLFTLVWQSPQI
jgi:hypothetical protein